MNLYKKLLDVQLSKPLTIVLSLLLLFLTLFQTAGHPAATVRADESGLSYSMMFPLVYHLYDDSVTPPVGLPVVEHFTASETTITEGESTTLSWLITGAVDTVSIDNGVGDVTGLGSIDVSPVVTTLYVLTAVNSVGSVTAELTVVVESVPDPLPPVIESFTASDSDLEMGDTTTLTWLAGNFDTLSIDNGVGDVTTITETTVMPLEDTVYTLTASNSAGAVTESVSIVVNADVPPKILEFSASETTIDKGESVTLTFSAVNYDTLRIQGYGNVADKSSVVVSPTADITYKLVARNDFGRATDTVTIKVNRGGGGGGGGGGGTPPGPSTGGPQVVAFDWNGPVTESNRGFPYEQPPRNNGNWVEPYNYEGGVLYVRAEIKTSQPRVQNDMRLQLCFWQQKGSNRFALETCINTENVPGKAGNVACWSKPIYQMWKLNNKPLEWERGRHRVGVAVKNGKGDPVSNYNGWNWNGENPNHWYPFSLRFTGIVVPKGGSFSGWESYGGC